VFFPGGAAARTFTAAPKTATPFRVLTLVTRGPLMMGSYRTLPFRIQAPGGAVLAEQTVPVSMTDPADVKASVISTIDGGTVELRVANFTDRAQALALELPSPGIKMSSAPSRRLEVAAGAQGGAAFEFPRQLFAADRWCRMPYRVTLADGLSAVPAQAGAPLAGEEAVALRILSRWWVSRKDKVGGSTPALPDAMGDGGIGNPGESEDGGSNGNLAGIMIFGSARPPEGWKTVIYGASIEFGGSAPLPSLGSSLAAATRVIAPTDRDAIIRVGQQLPGKDPPRFAIRVWLNDRLVNDGNSVRIRSGGNTMLVECALDQAAPAVPGNVSVTFHNPKDDKQLTDLVLDIDRR
jgi:hypothetical protein